MSSIDAPSGLKAYMGTLVDQDDQMLQYQLRRVTQFWGMRSGGNGKKQNSSVRSGGFSGGAHEMGDGGSMQDDLGGGQGTTAGAVSRDEEYVYYMLAPPWARHKEPILYL